MIPKEPIQPTDPHLVWGRRRDRLNRRFQARSVIVENLISSWTKPDWSAVDVSGGAGRWLSTLAPRFNHFTHLDLSPDAVNLAQTDHPEFSHVDYGTVDLLKPRGLGTASSGRTWDAVFCFDTLLYRGDFVEICLSNIRGFMSARGIAFIDLPMKFRASLSRRVNGRRYRGPGRTFSPKAAHALAREAGYICVATAYQYAELTAPVHRLFDERGITGWLPWPSTWMYLVLRVDQR